MKNKLTLSTDRKSAAEGDYIEVSWACDACPDSLYLAYDSGSERYSMAVADSGTTRILIRKSDGRPSSLSMPLSETRRYPKAWK